MLTKKQLIVIGLIIIAAIVIAGGYYYYTTLIAPPTPIEIKIGLIFPLSGPYATGPDMGADAYLAAKIAIDMINERGGVLGKYPVKYWEGDDRGEAEAGASEAERLISLYGVQVIIGSWHSDATMAIGEVCERYGVVNWVPVAVSEAITRRGYKYVFRPSPDSAQQVYPIIDMVAENVDKLGKPLNELRMAIIHEDGAYGTGCADAAERRAKELGIPVVFRESYYAKATDLSSLILKLKEVNPDILFHSCRPPDAILFIKQARDLGLTVKAYITAGPAFTCYATYKALGPSVEYTPAAAFITVRSDSKLLTWLDPEVAAACREFIRRFTEIRGYEPIGSSYSSFGSTWILLTDIIPRAINKYGSVDPDSLVKAILETDLPAEKCPMGFRVKFYPPGHPNAGQNMYARGGVLEYIEGKLYNVWPPEYADKPLVFPLPQGHPLAPP